jgi:low affinity Fe/Cu permease
MKKITLSLITASVVVGNLMADEAALQAQIEKLLHRIEQLEKAQGTIVQTQSTLQESQIAIKEEQTTQSDLLSKVNAQSANDNIKWDIDLRSAFHNIAYQYADDAKDRTGAADVHAGKKYSNSSLLTNRLWLGMGSKVNDNLFFNGQVAANYYWGADSAVHPMMTQDMGWEENSSPHDASLGLRQAYFVYKFGNEWDIPMTFSAGRRAAEDGFLANNREGAVKPGSPLAHITNVEVDGAMVQFNLDKVFLPGSYLKVVYGRSYDSINENAMSTTPYVDTTGSLDKKVDFLVLPMSIYDNGASKLMAEYAMIINAKGDNLTGTASGIGAGTAHFGALSYQLDGLNEDIDFLNDSTVFASVAMTSTNPDNGYQMLGSTENKNGYSFWAGMLFPDMISNGGRFGLEYNYGSKYWTPMTWAEDSIIGSKIATRGNAYEGYWNLPIVGKNLSAQLRYTYIDHHYRSSISFMDDPSFKNLDNSQELRAFVRYQY